MPIPLINTVASWLLKKRLHQIELFIKYPAEVQNEVLMGLLDYAKNTHFGRQYDFKSMKSYEDFAARVPIVNYEGMESLISRARMGEQELFWPSPIKMFAKSSGTTNAKSKFIPVSPESLEDCHYKSSKDLLSIYLNNNENSQLFTGKSLRLGGSKELYESHGSVFGDLSALLIDNMPFWAEFSSTPSNKVSLMSDWDRKLTAVIEESSLENVTSMAGVPSWMLVLLHELLERQGHSHLFEVWDQLEVYFHGGVSFSPYKEQFKKILPRKSFNYYEIYNASEGFFAIQDRNKGGDLLLMLDYGIFYEFIPMDLYESEEEQAIPLSQVQLHTNYAIVITTNAGLWRYKVGDTMRFTSLNPYRIRISGRTRHHINVFGEELIIENAEEALKIVSKKTQTDIIEYTAAPIFMKDKEKGGHEWLIEFRTPPENLNQFTELLDNALKSLNSDYEAKRYNNMTLNMPVVHCAKTGTFHKWLATNDKLGGQHKIPRLSNSRKYLEELLSYS
ncbi:MAG: GH3 auxin-responsive promoter family protein [Flavobacteriaceae bacterium]|nr:GH3 auxin-responsive promoter family protein [Flavobacteriaceae bacterium]MCI5088609.1 GH3 auxin-responsive promoter family protein [Flavobacteriaceae bacterium]